MPAVLTDFSDAAVAQANGTNQEGCLGLLRNALHVECYDGPEMLRICTGVPFFFLNPVLRTRLGAATLDAWIEPTLNYYRSRGMPMAWIVSPSTQPGDLADHLQKHGLTTLMSMPGMAVDLEALPSVPMPSGVTLVEVSDMTTLDHWATTVSAGSTIPRAVMDVVAQSSAALGAEAQSIFRSFVAYRNGEPIGASSLYMGAGVAGIYCVAVLPEARRQGIGAAVTAAPLSLAHRLGYRIGVLQASEMGKPVYRRLGFKESGRFSLYGFPGPS